MKHRYPFKTYNLIYIKSEITGDKHKLLNLNVKVL